jgi:hypothetical protein
MLIAAAAHNIRAQIVRLCFVLLPPLFIDNIQIFSPVTLLIEHIGEHQHFQEVAQWENYIVQYHIGQHLLRVVEYFWLEH